MGIFYPDQLFRPGSRVVVDQAVRAEGSLERGMK